MFRLFVCRFDPARPASGRALALLLAACCTACGIPGSIDRTNVELRNAIDTLDRSIDALSRQSADWQVVLQDLEGSIAEDLQSTIRIETTNLVRTSVLGVGSEFRCDSDYLRTRLERELRRIRNELAEAANSAGIEPPIPLLPDLPVEPFVCSAVPQAVDASLDPERRTILDVYGFDLRSQPITAELQDRAGARRNVTDALGILGDFQMVLDLTAGGANVGVEDRRVLFGWDGEVRSVIPVLSPGAGTPSCEVRTALVTGDPQTFTPPHVRGDQDFDGNGPCSRLGVTLDQDALGQSVRARLELEAFECDGDFARPEEDHTTARGSTRVTLFTVPAAGDRILQVNLDSTFEHRWIDSDHQDDLFTFAGTQPVEKIRAVGDTDGDEAGIRTQAEVFFREMRVTYEDCGGSEPPVPEPPPPATARLTVSRFGSGSGVVTSSPPGIACGRDCSQDYPLGTSVTLTAEPASGSSFDGFQGAGCGGGRVVLDQSRTCRALFGRTDL
jgi:hypothetical protein